MAQYEGLIIKHAPEWPYPILYDKESEVYADVLIIGSGVSGCFAAVSAANKGLKVALVEKGATIRGGGAGAGIDHWWHAATNPACGVTPEELTKAIVESYNGFHSAITTYIQCRESYDAVLELEKMGMKIRDTEDDFKGADFRDEKTKLLFAYDYQNKHTLRIWGVGMKPALYRECKKLGVDIYDRVMVTSLLSEGGQWGAKVVGATGVDVRTGEFIVFKAKATVLCASRPSRMWVFDSEHIGLQCNDAPPTCNGDGHAIAWKAGAEFAMIEKSQPGALQGSINYMTGGYGNTWYPCTIVDAKGKEVPWVNASGEYVPPEKRGYPVNVPGQKFFPSGLGRLMGPANQNFRSAQIILEKEGITPSALPGFTPPFYSDLPSMSDQERRVIFGLMIGQEGRTSLGYRNLTQAGFEPGKDLLQVYPRGRGPANMRAILTPSGGILQDWDLKSTLEGLYGAGRALLAGADCSTAAATGRYAGRKAAEYAMRAKEPIIKRNQVEEEKKRVYAPVRRKNGVEWKELNSGIVKIMQDYCGDIKSVELLNIGLKWFKELGEGEAQTACARNPHELMRTLECLNMITWGEAIMHACLARKASSAWLGFQRWDYPEVDPPEWQKWITVKLEDSKVKVGERPLDYWGTFDSLKESYEAHCGL